MIPSKHYPAISLQKLPLCNQDCYRIHRYPMGNLMLSSFDICKQSEYIFRLNKVIHVIFKN